MIEQFQSQDRQVNGDFRMILFPICSLRKDFQEEAERRLRSASNNWGFFLRFRLYNLPFNDKNKFFAHV